MERLGHVLHVRAVIPELGELLRHHVENVIATEEPMWLATVPAQASFRSHCYRHDFLSFDGAPCGLALRLARWAGNDIGASPLCLSITAWKAPYRSTPLF
jgi:hypothetical protein